MTRIILDKELEELRQQIQQLGSLVERALSKALKALDWRLGDGRHGHRVRYGN